MSEYSLVEKPLLDQLSALGWTVIDQGAPMIPSDPAKSLRSSFRETFLPQVFKDSLRALNKTASGESWLTDRQLDDLIDQLYRRPNMHLPEINEAVQQWLFKAQVDHNEVTDEPDPTVTIVDFLNPQNNTFHAINQFRIDTPGCVKDFIIPDIVLFVNGLPLVVIEAKKGNANTANPMHEAFMQLQRYRGGRPDTRDAGLSEGEERLFYTNAFVIRTCGNEADFGTISSEPEHFYGWKHIWPDEYQKITAPLGEVRAQEGLVQGMLNKEALLDVVRTCSVFMDLPNGKRIKVVSRYQQHRAARKIATRLENLNTPDDRSGVIWHTQGSGKSLTMVFVGRMIRTSPALQDYKILLVVDRSDLEDQLSRTAKLIGGKINIIESRSDVRTTLGSPASDVNMVMVHKFLDASSDLPPEFAKAMGEYAPPPSAETFGVVNDSDRIIIMVDEAHRTQGSDMGDNLFEAFPNATRIAFTGTPLKTERHAGKKTVKRFGEYIDKYKLMDAVHDGATLQILYEGRTANTALRDKTDFDTAFEDLFADRSEEDLLAIKKKYGATGDILEAEKRIAAIAKDMVNHYIDNILPNEFKAQVVCHSKLAAIRYQAALRRELSARLELEQAKAYPDTELVNKIAFLKVAAIISADGTNEPATYTVARKEARQWNAVDNFCKPFNYNEHDKDLTGIAFLVVCDMLLTGFDAPVEQVMYIDKKLSEHNLLQAIARVNRTSKNKQRGFIVDYIGLANNLTDALKIYASEDADDIQKGFKNIASELPILEERFRRLLHFFQGLKVSDIDTFVHGECLNTRQEFNITNAAVVALGPVKPRADFEVYLKKFLQSLDLILPGSAAQPYRGPARRFGYLLQMTKQRYKDNSVNFAGVGQKVSALINQHLVELGVDPKIPPVELFDKDFIDCVTGNSKGNEQAKASEMEHAIRKHCTVHFDQDPAFYKRMSEKLDAVIARHGDDWKTLAEHYDDIRNEIGAGRTAYSSEGDKEVIVLQDNIIALARDEMDEIPVNLKQVRNLSEKIIELIRSSIGIVDFWKKPDEVKRLRAQIGTELLLCDIPFIEGQNERLAVELTKLAEKRHVDILK